MKRLPYCVVVCGIAAMTITSIIATCSDPAWAEDWPTRPLTLVVPFSAGGSSDTIGRLIADGIGTSRLIQSD